MNAKQRKSVVTVVCILLVLVLVASLLLSAFGGAFAVTQAQIDELKQQQSAIAEEKDRISGEIANLQGDMDTVLAQKLALDEQNELARQEIEIINEQIALYEELVAKKAQELEEAIAQEEAQKEALRVRMRNMEESGSLSYIAILFKASSFTDLLSRLDSINSIMNKDKELEDAYIAAREYVAEVKAEYEETLEAHEATKIELEAKKAQLEREIEAACQLIAQLQEDIDRYREEFEANEAAEAALNSQIQNALAEFERQQQENIANGGTGGVVGTGNYVWPLPGGPSSYPPGYTYGWRVHPIFGDNRWHAGEDIGAPSGTPIYAVDSGTVAIATLSSSYGNYVVVSHGNSLSSLYAHMSSMAVSAGQSVNKGDVIGYVGSTGWSTGPHLHLEMRVNGSNVDPKPYFGL